MISVVNGYVCFSSCDVEKAKQGKNPHAAPGALTDPSSKTGKTSGYTDQPAIILDGALSASAVGAADGSTSSSSRVQPPLVNLLV
jgi:hypothetical protein